MFVNNFQKLQGRKKAIKFSNVEMSFEWNKNTESFVQIEKDVQGAIDKFKGMDLKSMVERNIHPELDGAPVYGDITHLKDVNLGKMFDLGHLEISEEDAEVVAAAAAQAEAEKPADNPEPEAKDVK